MVYFVSIKNKPALHLFLVVAAVAFIPPASSLAADDKAIAAERREAQKQRQQQKSERLKKNNAALKQFRKFVSETKRDYRERARELDTEFRLQRTELQAERQMKTAEAEAELQQNITQLFLNPQSANDPQQVEKLKADMKAYQDKMYEIRKQAALEEHEEFIANETRKHELMTERDNRAMDEATALGLLDKYEPILAAPIGGSLTPSEERWNEREKTDVERLFKNNQRQVAEFSYGGALREWEIENKREDFKLEWEKRAKLHELSAEQQYFNSLMFSGGNPQNQQEMAKQLSELSKKSRMINIEHNKNNKLNQTRRNQEKRKIMGR